jgi:polycomb protein EED
LTGKDKVDWNKTRALWDEKYEMRDAFKPIEAHKEEVVKAWAFTGRQVGWSRDAEWCIVVGSGGVLALFQRKIAPVGGTGGGEHVDEGNPQ